MQYATSQRTVDGQPHQDLSKAAATDLNNLIEGYKLCARAEGKSEKTILSSISAVRYFADFVRSLGIATDAKFITAEHLRLFIRHLQQVNKYLEHPYSRTQEQRLSPHSVNTYVRAIRAFWSWLAAEELIEENALARVKPPKVPKRITRTLSDKEMLRLVSSVDLASCNGFRDRVIVLVLLDCALRAGELVSLTVDDIDFAQGVMKVKGKGSKERMVPFGARVAKELWKYLLKHRPQPEVPSCQNLFLTRNGRPLTVNRVEKVVRSLKEKAGLSGLKLSPHTLRHTGATAFLRSGGDCFALQKLLGHTSLDMTRHYADLADTQVKAAHRLHSPIDNLGLPPSRKPKRR
jgi:site-specific recombinase XerD